MAANSDELDEKAKPPVIQQKGRFKVTSENVCLEKVTWILILMPSSLIRTGHQLILFFFFPRWFLLHYKRATACRFVVLRSARMCQNIYNSFFFFFWNFLRAWSYIVNSLLVNLWDKHTFCINIFFSSLLSLEWNIYQD